MLSNWFHKFQNLELRSWTFKLLSMSLFCHESSIVRTWTELLSDAKYVILS